MMNQNLEGALDSKVPEQPAVDSRNVEDSRRILKTLSSKVRNLDGTRDSITIYAKETSPLKQKNDLEELYQFVSREISNMAKDHYPYHSTSLADKFLIREVVMQDLNDLGITQSNYDWKKQTDIVQATCYLHLDLYNDTHFYRYTKTYANLIYAAKNAGSYDP
jgi:hypothetical protein